MIQTLPPQTPHQAFTDSIRTRRREGRVDQLDAGRLGHPLKHGSVLLVMVTDQVLWLLLKGCRVTQRLGDPFVRRVVRHSDMQHAPPFMLHDHKGVHRLEK
jgi:hypothetical protein